MSYELLEQPRVAAVERGHGLGGRHAFGQRDEVARDGGLLGYLDLGWRRGRSGTGLRRQRDMAVSL